MKKFLALAVLAIASMFCRGAVADTTASATIAQMGPAQLVTVFATPTVPYQVFTFAGNGQYVPAGCGAVSSNGVGHTWIPAPAYNPPLGVPAVYVTIYNLDGTITNVVPVHDDGWWLE